jgi:signal transduction histidine kinase
MPLYGAPLAYAEERRRNPIIRPILTPRTTLRLQVLINLVGNAIKFTDAGEVAIKAEAMNGSFYVSVRDTGPGISAADQAKLFQEFQQADNAITKNKGGTGLGLAISKRIIEMHGGRIWVESQVGQGSTFTFTLPVVVEQQVEPA